MARTKLLVDDLLAAADWSTGQLARIEAEAWNRPAPGDSWTVRQTVDHIADALLFYAGLVATRATARITPIRNGDPTATPDQLTEAVQVSASVLTAVLGGLSPSERAFHPSGTADVEGWLGMACTEILVHTHDVLALTDRVWPGPGELAARVVDRVLPWTPPSPDGWGRLLQATGRDWLGDHPPAAADWWWQSAPLEEWDGIPWRRTAPPQWQ